MSITANQRGSRSWTTAEELPVSSGAPLPPKKKWSNAMPLFIALVVVAEIIFLGRLDVAKNVAMVDSWADLFYRSPPSRALIGGADDLNSRFIDGDRISELGICEEWLEKEDAVTYSRDFQKEPILVSGSDEVSFFIRLLHHASLVDCIIKCAIYSRFIMMYCVNMLFNVLLRLCSAST